MYNASELWLDKAQGATFHNTMTEHLFPNFFSADAIFVVTVYPPYICSSEGSRMKYKTKLSFMV